MAGTKMWSQYLPSLIDCITCYSIYTSLCDAVEANGVHHNILAPRASEVKGQGLSPGWLWQLIPVPGGTAELFSISWKLLNQVCIPFQHRQPGDNLTYSHPASFERYQAIRQGLAVIWLNVIRPFGKGYILNG